MHERFLRRNTSRFVKKAKTIATVSEFSKRDILEHYPASAGKIDVVYSAAKPLFHPITEQEKLLTKKLYSDEREYFLYAGALQPRKNLINLLRAFSVFKKRQQSAMKLVLCGRLAWKNDGLVELLKTYKYKEDVVLTGYVPEEALWKLMGSAHALVYPSFFEGFGVPVLEAMKCNVPVLTSENTSMQEIAGDAAIYFDPASHVDIAEKMMLLYKDEALRKSLIEKGGEVAPHYSWHHTAQLLWNCAMKAVPSKAAAPGS